MIDLNYVLRPFMYEMLFILSSCRADLFIIAADLIYIYWHDFLLLMLELRQSFSEGKLKC